MLQIVAIPVQERLFTPGPWYSTMAPVPPLTVRMPATLRMISEKKWSANELEGYAGYKLTFGSSPTRQFSSELNSNDFGCLQLPWKASHDINGIGSCLEFSILDNMASTKV